MTRDKDTKDPFENKDFQKQGTLRNAWFQSNTSHGVIFPGFWLLHWQRQKKYVLIMIRPFWLSFRRKKISLWLILIDTACQSDNISSRLSLTFWHWHARQPRRFANSWPFCYACWTSIEWISWARCENSTPLLWVRVVALVISAWALEMPDVVCQIEV